jgi:hypothetical protein
MKNFQPMMETVRGKKADFDSKSNTREAAERIQQAVDVEQERQSVDGIFTGNIEGLKKYEQSLIARQNVNALTAGTEFQMAHDAAVKTVATVRASFETVKLPSRSYTGRDEGTKAIRRTADAMETSATYLRFQGRSLADVADAYERATDDGETVFIALVESGLGDGWRSFPITPREPVEDTTTVLRLKQQIGLRRAARVPAEVIDAERELKQMMSGSVDAKIRLLKQGRLHIVAS